MRNEGSQGAVGADHPCCVYGLELDRDENAARNVLRRGLCIFARAAACLLPTSLVGTQPLIQVAGAVHPDESFVGLRGDRKARISLPDFLVAWPRVVLAVEVSAEHGHGEHRQPEIAGREQLAVAREVLKRHDLDVGEEDVCRQFRGFTAHHRHRRQPPCDHRVDGYGALDAIAGAMTEVFDLAA